MTECKLLQCELNKDDTSGLTKLDGKNPQGFSSTQ